MSGANINFDNLSMDNLKQVMVRIYKGSSQQEITEATAFLIAFSQTMASVPTFVQILTQDPVAELRLLSGIILKKSIGIHLPQITGGDRDVLRNTILTRFFDEPHKTVQKTIAMLIAIILKLSAEVEEKWTDPIVVISQRTKPDQNEATRLQGFLLLTIILEISGKHLSDFYNDLYNFFMETIRDNSPIIRKQTLLCVLNMYNTVSDDDLMSAFNNVFPYLIEILYQTIKENDDDDTIEKALDVLFSLTNRKADLFSHPQLTKLVEIFCTEDALLSRNLNRLFQENMIDIILNIVANYKAVISKNEILLNKVIEVTFTLACIKEEEKPHNRDTIQDVALSFIREAGNLLPKKKSYPMYKEYLLKMFESSNTAAVEGAFLILGNLSEGCCEYLRRELPTLMKAYIQKGLESPNNDIKVAAFTAINYFAEFLVPEIIVFHEIILPLLIKNLDNTNQKALEGNVACLEIFCEEMNEDIIHYIPDLIPKFIDLIDKDVNTMQVKRHAVLAISSCARVAKEKFAPYAKDLVPLLAQLVNLNNAQYVDLKATASKCIGVIVASCLKENPEVFKDHVEPLVETIYLHLKDSESTYLKECSLEFFYNLAFYLGAGFKPYLDKLVEVIYGIFESLENLQKQKPAQIISLNPDDDEDEDVINADQTIYEEVAAAICCLGEMAKACPADFAPYYEKTTICLQLFVGHFDRLIREQSLKCYASLTKAIIKLGNNGELPKFNRGLPCGQRFSNDAEQFLYQEVYERFITTLQMDDDISILVTILEILHEFCTDLGPASIDLRLERITEQLIKIFQNETNAQNQAFDEGEEVHGELFGAATFLVIDLIKTCGEGYFSHFQKLYPELKKFVSEDSTEDDVAEVIACFAKAVKFMPVSVTTYAEEILNICIAALNFGDEYINQNVAYCLGEIVEYGKDKVFPYYDTIFQKLRVIYDNSTLNHTRDNAIASIARMVYTNPSLVPTNVMAPAIIKELPLQGDPKENRTLIKMLIFLFETNIEILNGIEERCIELLIDGINQRKKYKIKDENVLRAIGLILKNLSANEGAKAIIQKTAKELPQETVDILSQLIS